MRGRCRGSGGGRGRGRGRGRGSGGGYFIHYITDAIEFSPITINECYKADGIRLVSGQRLDSYLSNR